MDRVPQGSPPEERPIASGGDPTRIGHRLQVLATEHWSLLAARSLTWNEIFTRASMFLSALSGAIVALALLAQVSALRESFATFALVILPVVFFLGLTTYLRLVKATQEDLLWVAGMNRIRAGYLEITPEVEPYLITSPHDDLAGVGVTSAFVPSGRMTFLWPFVGTPSAVWVITSVVAGAIFGVVAAQLGAALLGAVVSGVVGSLAVSLAGIIYGRQAVEKSVSRFRPLNPTPVNHGRAESSVGPTQPPNAASDLS